MVSSAPVVPSSGPNPAVAGILAGFFPFGVGAVYCGQYAKGLAHLLIFFGLVYGASNADSLDWLFGIGIAFFYVWQIIDAVRTAHAVSAGQPAPDPLGLGQALGAGEKVDTSKIPAAAVVLIGLGVLFLLRNVGVFEFSLDRIASGAVHCARTLVVRQTLGLDSFSSHLLLRVIAMRGLTGPVVLVTLGVLSLIEDMGGPRWHRTWPILLLAIGITKLLERQGPTLPPPSTPGPSAFGSTDAGSGEVQPPAE